MYAVSPCAGIAAAVAKSSPSGNGMSADSGQVAYSAYVPLTAGGGA